jgi:hypothetical protein
MKTDHEVARDLGRPPSDGSGHGGPGGSGHGGHGWMMVACCIPMLIIAVVLAIRWDHHFREWSERTGEKRPYEPVRGTIEQRANQCEAGALVRSVEFGNRPQRMLAHCRSPD